MIRGLTVLACMEHHPDCADAAYLSRRDGRSSARCGFNWRSSMWVGIFSVLGSACWALAMTLENAALVRAVGQIELVFTFIASHVVLKERPSVGEWIGSLLVVGASYSSSLSGEQMTETNPRPLHGLRVLDFSTTIAGPHCSRLLADMGADVVKVESPEGDLMRSRPVQRDGASARCSASSMPASARSCSTSSDPRPSRRSRKLAAKVDVVLENYRPGVMKRLGIDYPELAKGQSPSRLCAISGYGQTGRPPAGRPTRRSSMPRRATTWRICSTSTAASGRTIAASSSADYASGSYAMGAILAALYQRNAPGQGRWSTFRCSRPWSHAFGEVNARSSTSKYRRGRCTGPIEAKDGYVMLATASERTFRTWRRLRPARLLTDPRFEKYADRRRTGMSFVDGSSSGPGSSRSKECVGGAGEAWRALLALSHRDRGASGSAGRASRLALHHRGQRRRLQVALPPFRFSGSAPAKRPQGRESRRTHQERPRRSGAQRRARSRRC